MIPTRNLRVGNIRNPKSSLGRVLAIAAVAVPAGGLAMCGPAANAQAAGPGGTLVTIQDDPASDDDQVVTVAPDGSASHAVAYGSPLSSVSMANDGTIYIASDDQYTDDDHMWAFTQNGSLLDSWKVPNAGQGELYGGISDSEVRRDGARLITQSIWSNCNGGGISEICNVRDVTVPGTAASLGDMINENGAAWLGNSDYIVVDGGLSYYKVGAEDSVEWFEDTEVWRQYDGSVGTTADGSLMAVITPPFGVWPFIV